MPRATTKRVADPVQTRSSRTGERRRRPRLPLVVVGALALAVLWAASFTTPGRFATAYIFVVLNFYIGVITLVALSVTVMAGLVSTDRIMLRIGHRVLFQGIHRATAVLAMVALGIHIAVKVLAAHAALGDVVVPFYSRGRSQFIGFGTIASYLMLAAFWSGLARTRFIRSSRPWIWRVLHCAAYPCWLVALAHGLNAGRQAATWVTASYVACVIGVALALLVRLYTKFGRYSLGAKTERAIGVNAQTAFMFRFREAAPARMPAEVQAAQYAPESGSDRDRGRAHREPAGPPAEYAEPWYGGNEGWDAGPDRSYVDYPDDPAYTAEDRFEMEYPTYQAEPYAEPYVHDYWAEPAAEPQERPRLRLVTGGDTGGGSRQTRTEPRGRRRTSAEDYRAG